MLFFYKMKLQKGVTKPAPECLYPGVKTGVQGFSNVLKFLDSYFPAGLPGNDGNGLSAIFCESIL
jgi:hypothetical protein